MLEWTMRRGQIKHLLYEHCLNGRIDKQLLIEQFNDLNNVEPTRHGRWKHHQYGNTAGYYECDNCGKINSYESNYCPNCGAKMDLTE